LSSGESWAPFLDQSFQEGVEVGISKGSGRFPEVAPVVPESCFQGVYCLRKGVTKAMAEVEAARKASEGHTAGSNALAEADETAPEFNGITCPLEGRRPRHFPGENRAEMLFNILADGRRGRVEKRVSFLDAVEEGSIPCLEGCEKGLESVGFGAKTGSKIFLLGFSIVAFAGPRVEVSKATDVLRRARRELFTENTVVGDFNPEHDMI
jgi:hypothetical protein